MLTRLFAATDAVARFLGGIAAVLTVAIAIMILAEIAARALFNYSLSFAWEYSAYCMAVAMFFGAAFTLRTGGHIRVSLLASSVPPRAAYVIDLLCTLCGIVIAGYLSFALLQLAWRSFESGSVSATISATPLVIPQGGIALGAVLLTLQLIVRLLRLTITDEAPEDTSGGYQVD